MSNTVEGARSMVQTMRETGKLLQIGHQRRSNPRYLFALNRLINEAKICGRLTAAQAQWNRAASPDLGWPKGKEIPDDVLRKYGYDSEVSFAEASATIDALARNGWKRAEVGGQRSAASMATEKGDPAWN